MSLSLIITGVVLLVIGIIMGHFFPSRYWIALIAVGIVIMVVGVILLLIPTISLSMSILPSVF
jgi:hypothetical protein